MTSKEHLTHELNDNPDTPSSQTPDGKTPDGGDRAMTTQQPLHWGLRLRRLLTFRIAIATIRSIYQRSANRATVLG